MEHGPQQSQPQNPESALGTQKALNVIDIPPAIALPFQMKLFATYFTDKDGEKIVELNDDIATWLSETYGEAFRDYCDSHRKVAKDILNSNGDIGALSLEDINEIIVYVKTYAHDPAAPRVLH